jgi:hypothetical protein
VSRSAAVPELWTLGIIDALMRAATLSLICSAVLFCGCNDHDGIHQGSGDAGPLILKSVRSFGGHPIATKGLSKLDGDWRYARNKTSLGIVFPISEYTNVEEYLHSAFGPSQNAPGHTWWHVGAYITLGRAGTNTEVFIVR